MARSKFYVIRKSDFPKLIDKLREDYRFFAPVRENGEHNFREMKSGSEFDAKDCAKSYVNVEFPEKKFFLPDGETLVEYGSKGKTVAFEAPPKSIVFGVRPCDTHALDVLDRVMLKNGHPDSFYAARRASTLVFALNCSKAGKDCFCESMGADVAVKFDLLFTDSGSEFHVETGSAKGREIAKLPLFRKTARKANAAKLVFRKKIDTRNLEKIMTLSFASPIWGDVANRCLSCGSCTNVCPTCYCFDMPHSKPIGRGIKVKREWNYCMLRGFTRVAGGGVFREPRSERVKQFFYHKLAYGRKNQGKFHCVGCGRCIKECMTHIDITEEAAKIREEHERKSV
jgi:ferredoxin